MLTAAIDGLVDRFGLRASGGLGRSSPEPCLKHAARLQPDPRGGPGIPARARDPGGRHPAGVRHRPPVAAISVANKIALGTIDSGIAGGTDTTSDAPVAISDKLRKKLMRSTPPATPRVGSRRSGRSGPATSGWRSRRTASRAPGLSMGEHAALTALEWEITRRRRTSWRRASHQHLAAAYERGFLDDQVTPFRGLERDNNLRPDSTAEKLGQRSSRSSARARPRP